MVLDVEAGDILPAKEAIENGAFTNEISKVIIKEKGTNKVINTDEIPKRLSIIRNGKKLSLLNQHVISFDERMHLL